MLCALAAQAQLPLPPVPWALPGLNLSAPDPVSAAVAGGVNLALARANGSGALPALGLLNDQFAAQNPLGGSPLATLPQPSDVTQPIRLNPLRFGTTVLDISLSSSTEMQAAILNLNAAQLQEAGRLIQSIGHQLLAGAGLAFDNKTVVGALAFAGDDLLGIGDALEAAAAHAEGQAIQEVILGIEDKADKADKAAKAAKAQAASSQDAFGPDGTLDPRLVYGTWERLENAPPPARISYTFTRTEFVKRNATTANRRKAVLNEVHPGAVTAYVSYELPEDDACPGDADACPGAPLGQVAVTILIEQASGKTLTLAFNHVKAQGASLGKDPEASFDVLIEREGDKKAFVKIS